MSTKQFLDRVWSEILISGSNRIYFDAECLADMVIDGKEISCDAVDCSSDGLRFHDETESDEEGWIVVDDDTVFGENHFKNVMSAIDYAMDY